MASNEAIEVTVARMDERFKAFQDAFLEMGKDMSRLSESYEELVKSNQRIALVEVALATSEKSLALLWHKWDSKEKSESAEKSKILFEVLKLVGAVIIGGVLAHFGLRLDL
jgi:DNA anti-recombination protein RmuC